MTAESNTKAAARSGLWEDYITALDKVTRRLQRITNAFQQQDVPYALVGGQAVAIWVATKDPAAVRTTKDINILLRRKDLPQARAAANSLDMDYFETMGVGMFLDRADPNPRHAVHLVWAGEQVRPNYVLPSPSIDERETLGEGPQVISLAGLVRMKLLSHRDQDRVHLRDMIDVGLFGREMLQGLPEELALRLDDLLTEAGRVSPSGTALRMTASVPTVRLAGLSAERCRALRRWQVLGNLAISRRIHTDFTLQS